jgi:CBS domain-containing protein
MIVRDIMSSDVETVSPDMPAVELDRAFIERGVSGFPVVEDGMLVGVVSRSDVVRTLNVEQANEEMIFSYYREHPGFDRLPDAAEENALIGAKVGSRLASASVADFMIKATLTAQADDDLKSAAGMLVRHRIHRLPVTENGRLVGILTSSDLVALIADGRYWDALGG